MRVLVVSHQPAILSVLEKHLTVDGYEITTHLLVSDADLKDIQGSVFEDKFDVAVISIVMPFMDGYELAKWLRSLSKGIRIVAVDTSAVIGNELVQSGIVDAFVQMPFEVEKLRDALQQPAV